MRGQRISYGVNLPLEIHQQLEAFQQSAGGIPFGAIAVEAIRTTWKQIRRQTVLPDADDDIFPPTRLAGTLSRQSGAAVRHVFYISRAEAEAIEQVRRHLGDIEIGQLHRLAFERYFNL